MRNFPEVSSKSLRKFTARGFPSFRSALLTRCDDVCHRSFQYIDDEEGYLKNYPKCLKERESVYTYENKILALRGKKEQEAGELSGSLSMDTVSCVISQATLSTKINDNICCFICKKSSDFKGKHILVLVSSYDMQISIHQKAKELDDESILMKIEGHGDFTVDMIAKDFKYHRLCMNAF